MGAESGIGEVQRRRAPAAQDVGASSTRSDAVPRRPSRFLLRFFDIYLSLYVPLHFRALRVAHAERFPLDARPLIVVINHPSWWDPLTSLLLSRFFLRQVDHYAPIDSVALPRHRILGGVGLFPVEQNTPRGAAQFLRASRAICSDPQAVLWLTPQGGFTDVRTRPVLFKSGLASLVKRLERVTVLPLAYEYTFWDEAKPEILACCGEPLEFCGAQRDADVGIRIAAALEQAQDDLAGLALTRDAGRFERVMAGWTGVGWARAMWRNLCAAIRLAPYRPLAERAQGEPQRAEESNCR